MSQFDMTLCLLPIFLVSLVAAGPQRGTQKVLIDTDFAMPPTDDALALMMALNSPELNILGISTVAGNRSREQATADLLRFLEIADREELPVYDGAKMPLVHTVSEFAVKSYGEWYLTDPPERPPGGFASKNVERQRAVDFLIQTCRKYPGEVAIIALGPLTNIAMAICQDPEFVKFPKRLYIMGGAIASLPDGGGNITPNAEFNFWVDPEAARIVLRSNLPIELSPLNVSRKTGFKKKHLEAITRIETPLTKLLGDTMNTVFAEAPDKELLMYDQVAVAAAIDPSLIEKVALFVDVDTCKGINYGVSVGGSRRWPGAEESRQLAVQYDLDWPRFIRLFIERVTVSF